MSIWNKERTDAHNTDANVIGSNTKDPTTPDCSRSGNKWLERCDDDQTAALENDIYKVAAGKIAKTFAGRKKCCTFTGIQVVL